MTPQTAGSATRRCLPRLVRHGFSQGKRDAKQSGDCCVCEKTVRRNRGWWVKISYEYDEWDCYCKKCANDKMRQDDMIEACLDDAPNGKLIEHGGPMASAGTGEVNPP